MDRLLSMRVLLRVVDEGGFAAASRALDMSPAVVTRLIADLEDHLGTRLLHRTTRRLALTEAGETYLARVRLIVQDIDEADAATSAHTQELAGTLRLHAPPVLATYLLAPLLAGFLAQYPRIVLDVEVGAPRDLSVEDYDITLLGSLAGLDPDVVVRPVIAARAVLVASPLYLQRRGNPTRADDLLQHDCLRLKDPGSNHPRLWRLWREDAPDEADALDLPISPVLWANHTDTLLRAALDGAGITSIAADLVAPYLVIGQLVRVLPPWITGRLTVYAALPSRKFMPQRTRVFLDYLIEQARQQASTALQACSVC
jgi:DNA-binding transcriptional LysR family regulator